jgi:hypothetical protein
MKLRLVSMNNKTNYGKLLVEAPHRRYIIFKIVGVIFTLIFSILLILLMFIAMSEFTTSKNTTISNVLFTIVILIFVIFLLRYIFLHGASSQIFRIYKNGISPHIRPIHLWMKRSEYFIPFNELEKIEIGKTTDGSRCIILYPKKWKRIVVEYSDTGRIVFDKLLEIAENHYTSIKED